VIVYGRNAVREVLRGPRAVARVWATARAADEAWLGDAGVPVSTEDGEALTRRAGSHEHQGVCAEVADYEYADANALLAAEAPLIVALDEVQDPQNLGAERRSAPARPASCCRAGARRT
jgi:23S rRNA (guanosine2251-2'-O)-methyltransferase